MPIKYFKKVIFKLKEKISPKIFRLFFNGFMKFIKEVFFRVYDIKAIIPSPPKNPKADKNKLGLLFLAS